MTTTISTETRCRALVAGFGRPGMRDLDFGHSLVRYLEGLDWPEGVVVEDLSYAATLVLHRLQELDPAKLVLVGSVARGLDPPGTLRRYRLDPGAPRPEDVQRSLEESVQGVVDVDHTVAVARHWGHLPAETTVIEVEPADCSFGPGFSEELATGFDDIVAMVRAEVDSVDGRNLRDVAHARSREAPAAHPASPVPARDEPSPALSQLIQYADRQNEARALERSRAGRSFVTPTRLADHLTVVGRRRPSTLNALKVGNWFDVVPLAEGWFFFVVGDVDRRGPNAGAATADLRTAVRAYAVAEGPAPGRVLEQLDRLVRAFGLGRGATVSCAAVRPATRTLHLANAGHCPPLLRTADGDADFLWHGRSGRVGHDSTERRGEARLVLAPGSTLLLFSDGLVDSPTHSLHDGLARLRRAAESGPATPDALCEHVLRHHPAELRADDHVSVLALGLSSATARGPAGG